MVTVHKGMRRSSPIVVVVITKLPLVNSVHISVQSVITTLKFRLFPIVPIYPTEQYVNARNQTNVDASNEPTTLVITLTLIKSLT